MDRTWARAVVRLEWQRASEFESGGAVDDGECDGVAAEAVG